MGGAEREEKKRGRGEVEKKRRQEKGNDETRKGEVKYMWEGNRKKKEKLGESVRRYWEGKAR